jgi:hypothetical protein
MPYWLPPPWFTAVKVLVKAAVVVPVPDEYAPAVYEATMLAVAPVLPPVVVVVVAAFEEVLLFLQETLTAMRAATKRIEVIAKIFFIMVLSWLVSESI